MNRLLAPALCALLVLDAAPAEARVVVRRGAVVARPGVVARPVIVVRPTAVNRAAALPPVVRTTVVRPPARVVVVPSATSTVPAVTLPAPATTVIAPPTTVVSAPPAWVAPPDEIIYRDGKKIVISHPAPGVTVRRVVD